MNAFVTGVLYSFEKAIEAKDAVQTKLLCFNLALLTRALGETPIARLEKYSIEASNAEAVRYMNEIIFIHRSKFP